MSPRYRLCAIVSAMLFAWPAFGDASTNDILDHLGTAPSTEELIERVNGQVKANVVTALDEYDRTLQQQPYDVALRVQRCKFLDEYTGSFETASFLDDLYEMSEECDRKLEEDFAGHPEVLLRGLASTYGEERLRQGREILATLLTEGWSTGQLARLYAAVAEGAELAKQSADAVTYAQQALRYDERANVRLILAREHLARGEKDQAVALLTTTFDAYKHADSWYLLEKMQLLARAGDREAAAALYGQLTTTEYYDHLEVAKALIEARAIDLARQEIEKAASGFGDSPENEKRLFLLEFEHGTSEAALAAYNTWRDAGWKQDPIGVNRAALLMRDADLQWKARDVLALCLALVALALTALACGTPVALVQYWGFLRRHRSGGDYPHDGWQLRHAWAALAGFGVASIAGIYVAGPIDFNVHSLFQLDTELPAPQLSRYVVAEGLLTVLAMIVLLRVASAIERPRAWSANWNVAKSLAIGAAVGAALRIPLMLTALSRPDIAPLVADNELWRILGQVRDELGLLSALWVLALVAPVVEEFIFRRVVIEAFTAHVGFARANLLQAGLFAAIHFDARAFIWLFGGGLLLGHLARRSGGLVAPIVTHAVFNLIAGIILLK